MKNIHVLPTDKPCRLHFDSKLFLSPNYQDSKTINSIVEGRNIYITSDEEIKEGDWYASLIVDEKTKWETTKLDCVVKADLNKTNEYLVEPFSKYCKKIILTTDQDLIKDGVLAIDDEFLEWFVQNPSCEWVNFEKEHDDTVPYLKMRHCEPYKIIIPKEESKQETLEQTAVEWLVDKMLYIDNEYDMKLITKGEYQAKRRDIIDQAKEMEQVQDTKRLLFFYKVSLIIGLKKTGKLLKEVDKEIKQ